MDIPTPKKVQEIKRNLSKEEATLVWLIGVLYKNNRVRTTSERIALKFKEKGWKVESAEDHDDGGYWICFP
jgi:hypothetical protein